MELCRILSIVLVMLVHTTFQSVGWDCSSPGILIVAAFSIIGVNVFVLITGYFSTEPKKISLANLLFICLFWMIIKISVRCGFGLPFRWADCFFVTKSNWFIPSYLCLLFLTPVLNAFCDTANERTLLGVVLILISFEVWFDLLPPHPGVSLGSQRGYSVISFVALYLLARYIRLYGIPQWLHQRSFSICMLCTITLAVAAMVSIQIGHPAIRVIYAHSNPLVILSAVSFLLTFEKMSIKENGVINHIAKSTLPVLLAHSAVFFLYTKQFRYIFSHFSLMKMIVFWVLAIVVAFVSSVAVDQIRLLLWGPIEKSLRRHITKNELF